MIRARSLFLFPSASFIQLRQQELWQPALRLFPHLLAPFGILYTLALTMTDDLSHFPSTSDSSSLFLPRQYPGWDQGLDQGEAGAVTGCFATVSISNPPLKHASDPRASKVRADEDARSQREGAGWREERRGSERGRGRMVGWVGFEIVELPDRIRGSVGRRCEAW